MKSNTVLLHLCSCRNRRSHFKARGAVVNSIFIQFDVGGGGYGHNASDSD